MQILRNKRFWGLTAIIAALLFSYFKCFSSSDLVQYEFAEVSYRDVLQEVSVTGTVEADPKIELRFQISGEVDFVNAEVGDNVSAGNILAALDATSLSIKKESAEADLALAQAKYDQVVAGSTDEEIAVAQASFEKAQADFDKVNQDYESTKALAEEALSSAQLVYDSALTDYENALATYGEDVVHAYEDLYNEIDSSLGDVNDAMRDIDNILGVDDEDVNDDFELALETASGGQYEDAQSEYEDVSDGYDSLFADFALADASDYIGMDSFADFAYMLLLDLDKLLDDADSLLMDAPTIGGYSQTVKDSKRTIVASEITDVAAAISALSSMMQAVESAVTSEDTSLSSAEDALSSAKQALSEAQVQADSDVASAKASLAVYEALVEQAQAGLDKVKASPRDVDLAGLEASMDSAQAALDLAEYNLSLVYLLSPVSGVITEVNYDAGENISTTDVFLVMVSSDYQVTANVSETDIANVEVGDKVSMTLDAFSYDKIFEGEIIQIDPAETVVQGVIYYQVKAAFALQDSEIKPGMTANMDIVTAELEGVLALPVKALKYDKARTYVLQVNSMTSEMYETDVEVGVKGDQYVEVLGGLAEGDQVVTYVRD